ncbi:hypothetical protein Bca4012_021707 [Brassica carinata]
MGLKVADSESLPSGWRRYVKLLLYVAKKKLGKLEVLRVPLTKLLDEKEGFLVNGELMIVSDVEVHEVIDTYDCSKEPEGAYASMSEMKPCDIPNLTQESIDVHGFQVLPSQVNSVQRIFEKHPHIAVGFREKNQHMRKTSVNFLLSVIETLCQSLQDLSSEDLEQAVISLTYLKYVGFKVAWLERKVDEVKERKDREESSLTRLMKLKQIADLDALIEEE